MELLCPKYIIENGNLILAKVKYHRQLALDENNKENIKGGEWFLFKPNDNKFIFHSDSHDYGQASLEDVRGCVENGRIFTGKCLSRNISFQHKFAYNTGCEIIDLEVKVTADGKDNN